MSKGRFFNHINQLISDSETGIRRTPKGKKYAERTIKSYRTTRDLLHEYNQYLSFESITIDFYREWTNWLSERDVSSKNEEQVKKMATNSVGVHIKNLKVFMSTGFDSGLHRNLEFKKKDFRVLDETTTQIYLPKDDLEKFYYHGFSRKYQNVVDYFLIGCNTGLRYSDWPKVTDSIVKRKGKYYLHIMASKKTGVESFIPLNSKVIAILEKHKWELPPPISNQKFNEYIKEAAKIVGLTEPFKYVIIRGGQQVTEIAPKYQFISMHTARRTAATHMLLMNVPTRLIMAITGHLTEKSFNRYIRASSEDIGLKLSEFEFFN